MTRAQPPALPRNSNGRLGFPGPTQEEARNPLRNSRIPPQLEKNHVFPTSSQDEALACYGVSRKEPRSVLKCETVLCTLDATPNVPGHAGLTRQEHRGSRTTSSEHLLPSCSRQEGLFPCFVWKGFPTFPAHLRIRPVSRVNSRHSVVGGVTCRNTPISRPTLEKNPMPGHLFEGNPVDEGTKRRVTDTPVHHSVKAAGSTHSSTRGLSSHEQLERQAEFHSSTQDEA